MSKPNTDQIIIHICGPPGSGKTTLGRRIEKRLGDTVFVKDVDDLRCDFIKKFYGESKWSIIDKDAYQRYIDKFTKKRNKKPIVFVGLTTMPWWHKNHYYDLHATHRFYIDIDNDTILQRKYLRLLQGMLNDKRAIDDLLHQNKQFIKTFTTSIKNELDSTRCAEQNEEFKQSYLDMGYVLQSQSDIYDEVKKTLKRASRGPSDAHLTV